tara:strand:- start:2313 stop:3371 length:1059 start_codon:yes stop_codon:yes gene_type:complete
MTHGSLFSGIGGFDLASEWMGWENVFHCEYDPFCQKVLKHHFPNSKLYEDIKTFDATAYAGRIDILTGGFPCQPFSAAGKRLGTEDDRHLWPQMLRIIREVKPRYIVGENVRGLLSWSGGLVFDEVCSDLEAEGYEVTPYLLPACGKNAPHRRDRIWFIANSTKRNGGRNTRSVPSKEEEERICERNEVPQSIESGKVFGDAPDTNGKLWKHSKTRTDRRNEQSKEREESTRIEPKRCSGKRYAPDTDIKLSERRNDNREDGRSEQTERTKSFNKPRGWEIFPTQSPICGGDDGVPRELDGITFSKWRRESVKAYGNAIVPQVAYEIFKAIQKMEDLEIEEDIELDVLTQAH